MWFLCGRHVQGLDHVISKNLAQISIYDTTSFTHSLHVCDDDASKVQKQNLHAMLEFHNLYVPKRSSLDLSSYLNKSH